MTQPLSQAETFSSKLHLPEADAEAAISAAKFLKVAAYDAIGSSLVGAYQMGNKLTGDHLPVLQITDPHDQSAASTAGSLVGNTIKFLGLSKLAHNTLGSHTAEGFVVGAASGMLTPVSDDKNFWHEKQINALSSGISTAVMFGSAARLSHSSFLPVESSLAKTVAIGGMSGYLGGLTEAEVDSRLKTGHDASLAALHKSGAQYALMGAMAGGVLHSVMPEIASSKSSGELSEKTGSNLFKDAGSKFDALVAKHNPFAQLSSLSDNFGLQPAYASTAYGDFNSGWKAPKSSEWSPFSLREDASNGDRMTPKLKLRDSATVRPSRKSSGAFAEESLEKAPEKAQEKVSKHTLSHSIERTLGKTEAGKNLFEAFSMLQEEHPEVFGKIKSDLAKPIGNGKYTTVIQLADGQYNNAVLKLARFPAQSVDGLEPTEWNPEWGTRAWEAPQLSEVHSVSAADGSTVYGYVQERLSGMSDVIHDAEVVDDADFERHRDDPGLHRIFAELEEAGYRFVDPGSRQLGYSNLKQRLVVADYPAVAPASEAIKFDQIGQNPDMGLDEPSHLANNDLVNGRLDEAEEKPIDEQEGMSSVNFSHERFLNGESDSQKEAMRQTIANYVLDQTPDRLTIPAIEWEFADLLKDTNQTAKQAIAETRIYLKKEGLL